MRPDVITGRVTTANKQESHRKLRSVSYANSGAVSALESYSSYTIVVSFKCFVAGCNLKFKFISTQLLTKSIRLFRI